MLVTQALRRIHVYAKKSDGDLGYWENGRGTKVIGKSGTFPILKESLLDARWACEIVGSCVAPKDFVFGIALFKREADSFELNRFETTCGKAAHRGTAARGCNCHMAMPGAIL